MAIIYLLNELRSGEKKKPDQRLLGVVSFGNHSTEGEETEIDMNISGRYVFRRKDTHPHERADVVHTAP